MEGRARPVQALFFGGVTPPMWQRFAKNLGEGDDVATLQSAKCQAVSLVDVPRYSVIDPEERMEVSYYQLAVVGFV